MLFIKRIIDFYIDSSIHVAVAAYAMLWVSLLNFHIPYIEALGYVVFCTTVVGYNFIKYGTMARRYFIVPSRYIKIIQIFSFLCFGVAVFYAFQLRPVTLIILALATALTGLYALPFLPGRKSFRSLHGIKVYVVALCWSLMTVLLPIVEWGFWPSNNTVIVEFIQRFMFVLVLMLPFDIRDLKYDKLSLGTIPQKIGINGTKWLGIITLIVFYFLSFVKDSTTLEMVFANATIIVIASLFVFFSNEERSKYYSSFFVESIPILWLVVFLFFRNLL